MADISGHEGEGLDIRPLSSGTDIVGIFCSGNYFANISGNVINIGSVGITTDPLPISGIINTQLYAGSETWQGTVPWITLGSETTPLAKYKTNPAFEYEYANGDDITKIVQFINGGSYVQDITYSGGIIVRVGSYY